MSSEVWRDPCASYIRKVQCRIDIVSTLRGIGEDVDSISNIEVPMTVDHLPLGYLKLLIKMHRYSFLFVFQLPMSVIERKVFDIIRVSS